MNIDGSCGAFGDVGSGCLLRDNNGNWKTRFSSNEGQGDALFAEIFGVYLGKLVSQYTTYCHIRLCKYLFIVILVTI